MKNPFGRFKVTGLAVISIVLVGILQACVNEIWNGNKMTLKIGKDKDSFVEFVTPGGKEKFDKVLRTLSYDQYDIRYKKDDQSMVVEHYHPPRIGLKTDKITASDIAKNDPPGDPHVTLTLTTHKVQDIKDVLDALKSP